MTNPPVLELRVALTAQDYERLVKFYCDGLGIEPAAVWSNEGGRALMLAMGRATLEIFDARGRLVSTLYRGTPGMPAFARDWDGRRTDGRAVASGVYHARLTVGTRHVTRPVVLIR